MINWKEHKIEIYKKFNYFREINPTSTVDECLILAIKAIAGCRSIHTAIDWLTLEAGKTPDWIDDPNANPDNEFETPKVESQQNKIKFIRCYYYRGINLRWTLIAIDDISEIRESTNEKDNDILPTEIVTKQGRIRYIRTPLDKLTQLLQAFGIEVMI